MIAVARATVALFADGSLGRGSRGRGSLGRRCRGRQARRLGSKHRQYVGRDVEWTLGKEHTVAQHQIEALGIGVPLNLRDEVALHLADFLVTARRRVVLEFTGLARKFTLLVAQRLLRLGA